MSDNKKETKENEKILDTENLKEVNGGANPSGFGICPRCHRLGYRIRSKYCSTCGYIG